MVAQLIRRANFGDMHGFGFLHGGAACRRGFATASPNHIGSLELDVGPAVLVNLHDLLGRRHPDSLALPRSARARYLKRIDVRGAYMVVAVKADLPAES